MVGAVPHLNELQDKFGAEGLTILGVTKEGKKQTETWIESKGARYAYAYDKGGKLGSELGVRGIPAAFLLDATGRVVWEGHPVRLTEEVVRPYLEAALPIPLWDWPKQVSSAKTAFSKHRTGEALEKLTDAAESGDEVIVALKDAVAKIIDGNLAALEELVEAANYLAAEELAASIEDECGRLPAGEKAAAIRKRLDGDKEAQHIIKGQKKVQKLRTVGDLESENRKGDHQTPRGTRRGLRGNGCCARCSGLHQRARPRNRRIEMIPARQHGACRVVLNCARRGDPLERVWDSTRGSPCIQGHELSAIKEAQAKSHGPVATVDPAFNRWGERRGL